MKRSFFVPFVSLFILFWNVDIQAQTFDTADLRKRVSYMASDELGGRAPESEGSKKAANYLITNYQKAGLKLLCNNGFQPFNYFNSWTVGDSNIAIFNSKPLKVTRDFAPLDYFQTKKSSLSSHILLITKNLDSIDKNIFFDNSWVMIFDDNQGTKSRTKRALKAINHSAGGVLIVCDSVKPEIINTLSVSGNRSTNLGPILCISTSLADSILTNIQLNCDKIKSGNYDKKDAFIKIDCQFDATTHFIPVATDAKNIVVCLEGSDSILKNEYIVVGGHYDHLGTKIRKSKITGFDTTYIYHGADDNASGCIGVLELALKYASQTNRPKRSIIFVNFDAEEKGLIGSSHFFDKSLGIPASSVKAMINLDMIGRYSEEKGLSIIGIESSTEHKKMAKFIKKGSNLNISFSSKFHLFAGSDHIHFYEHKIPVFFFCTNTHPDYHKPTDIVEKINFKGMQEVLSIADKLLDNLANRKKNLHFQKIEF